MGILSEIVQIITNDFSVNMRKLMVDATGGVFKGTIEIIIHDLDDINKLSSRLLKIKGVDTVKRVIV